MTRPAVSAATNGAKVCAAILTIGVSVVARDRRLAPKVPTRQGAEDTPRLVQRR